MGELEPDVRPGLCPDGPTAVGGPPIRPEDAATDTLAVSVEPTSPADFTSGAESDVISVSAASVVSGTSDASGISDGFSASDVCGATSSVFGASVNDVDDRLDGDASRSPTDDVGG